MKKRKKSEKSKKVKIPRKLVNELKDLVKIITAGDPKEARLMKEELKRG